MMKTMKLTKLPSHAQEDRKRKIFCLRSCFSMYKAIALVLLSSFLMSVSVVIVKSFTTISIVELLFAKDLGVFVMNLPVALSGEKKEVFRKAVLLKLVLRGVFGVISMYMTYYAMRLMPLAEMSVILSTTPVWVMLLSRIFLKEKLDVLNTLSIMLSVTGLVLMSRVFVFIFSTPADRYLHWNYWHGCLLSLASAVAGAFTFVFMRKLKYVHESVCIAYNSAIGVIGTSIILVIVRKVEVPECGVDGAKMVFLGVCTFLGEFCVTSALKYEKAGAVSSVRTSSRVCMMFLWQIMVFGETPDVYSIVAAIIILVSLWLSVLRKYCQEKKRKAEARKRSASTEHEESPL